MTDAEKAEKILSIQAPSTKQALLRPPEQDMQWHRREIKNWLAVPEAVTWEEKVAARPISFEEVKIENKLRYDRGEHLQKLRGDVCETCVDEQKKERATNAFMNVFSPEKIKDKFKQLMTICGLGEKTK